MILTLVQTFLDGLSLGSLYALTALGIGLLFGVLRLINFSHGDLITVGGYALILPSIDVTARMGIGALPWVVVIVLVCGIVLLVALASDALVFRHLRRADPTTLMIASFGVGQVVQNTTLMLYGARPKAINLWPELTGQVSMLGARLPTLQLLTVGVTIVLLVALHLFLNRTAFGIQMRAAADDLRMAKYLGIRTGSLIAAAFGISGVLAGAVSLLFVTQTGGLSYAMGVPLMLFGFIATVVGGMGNLAGAVVGGFFVGFLSVLLQTYLPADLRGFRDAFLFGAVILVLVWRPRGLIASRTTFERV